MALTEARRATKDTQMHRVLFALLLFSCSAMADLDFAVVDGNDNGIGAVLAAHQAEANAAGTNTWLWGSAVWSDPSGSYVYVTFHRYGDGFLFRRGTDGNYTEITPSDPNIPPPRIMRPIIMDVDNNGLFDVIARNGGSILNTGNWTLVRGFGTAGNTIISDVNGDGYLDLKGYLRGAYGEAGLGYSINNAGTGFTYSTEVVLLPQDCPQEVVDRVEAADYRFHGIRLYEMGSFYIVTYAGGYSGEKFTYTISGNQVLDIGLPQRGYAHTPVDIDGDGDLDVVIQKGGTSNAGVYRQDNGTFTRDLSGYMATISPALAYGEYEWDVLPEDLDGDGDPDLVMSNKLSGSGWILDNQNGTFQLYQKFNHTAGEAVSIGDADGDGDIDVVATTGPPRDGNDVVMFINQSGYIPGDPPPEPPPPPEPTPQELIAVELNAAKAMADSAQVNADASDWGAVIADIDAAISSLTNARTIAEGEQGPNFP